MLKSCYGEFKVILTWGLPVIVAVSMSYFQGLNDWNFIALSSSRSKSYPAAQLVHPGLEFLHIIALEYQQFQQAANLGIS
jgi:hypothetical protein